MTKIYHLSNCGTCQKIIKALDPGPEVVMQDIKETPITEEQLTEMYRLAGSYEALFSRRAMKYRSMGLNNMELGEEDYKKYILEEYTFLKRPVIVADGQIFIGSAKKVVESVINTLKK